MKDKEIKNIQEIKAYVDKIDTLSTGAYNLWIANVTYVIVGLQTQKLMNTRVMYQYSGAPKIEIADFQPPYYSSFDTRYQTFECKVNCLEITGKGTDGKQYKVTIE